MLAAQGASYFLLLVRFTALMVVLPFFNWRGTPLLTKIGFAALLTYLIYLAAAPQPLALPQHFLPYLLAVAAEAMFGLALGYLVLLVFSAVRIAGQLIDLQAGLAMSSVFDPMFTGQVTIFGQYYYLLASLVFFTLDAHHQLFLALARTVAVVPPGGIVFQPARFSAFTAFFAQMIMLALQLAAPVVIVLIFCDLVLGLLSKTVPQLNVLMVGMPLKVGIALCAVYLSYPYLTPLLTRVFTLIQENLTLLLQLLQQP